MRWASVDLPEPDLPTIPIICPGWISSVTSLTTSGADVGIAEADVPDEHLPVQLRAGTASGVCSVAVSSTSLMRSM